MLALIALIIAAVAWGIDVLGDGLHDPWAWLFAAVAFLAAHFVIDPFWRPGPWHRA